MKTPPRTIHIDQLYTQDAFLSFCNDDHASGYGNKLGVKITPDFLMACEKDEFILPVCVQDKVKYYSPFQIFLVAELCQNIVDEDGLLRDGDLMDLAYQKEHKTRYINWGGQSAFNINNRETEKNSKSHILNQFTITKDFNSFVRCLHTFKTTRNTDSWDYEKRRLYRSAPEIQFDFSEDEDINKILKEYKLDVAKLKTIVKIVGNFALHIDPMEQWFNYIHKHPTLRKDEFKGVASVAQELYNICDIAKELVEAVEQKELPPLLEFIKSDFPYGNRDKINSYAEGEDTIALKKSHENLTGWIKKNTKYMHTLFAKHPEWQKIDFADSLEAARFASSEDEERYRINTGYDEQKAAQENFARRFPEKWEFYQSLNAKTDQQEKVVTTEKVAPEQKDFFKDFDPEQREFSDFLAKAMEEQNTIANLRGTAEEDQFSAQLQEFQERISPQFKEFEKKLGPERKAAVHRAIKERNDARTGSKVEVAPENIKETKLSPEAITNAYKTVYADGRMKMAFESLASRAYPDRRTYETNTPQSQSVFDTVLTRDANNFSQFEGLVAKEFERRNKNKDEIDDPATPGYRRKMLEDDALISGQMDSGIENLSRTLFNQEIDLNAYRRPTKEKPLEKSVAPDSVSLSEDIPKPESVAEKNIENESPIFTEKKSDPTEEEQPAPPAQEKFKSNEFIRDHIVENYLSYQDAELPDEAKRRMLEWSKSEESAKKYAEAVEQMAHKESLNRLQEKARELTDKMLIEAKRVGIPVSPYGKSISWAMWDLGKQFYYFTHQDEADPKYEIANPLLSEKKREEIINRHLGYEAYAAFNSPQSSEYKNKIISDKRFGKALELFNKAPNAKKTLNSKDLADLGGYLRV